GAGRRLCAGARREGSPPGWRGGPSTAAGHGSIGCALQETGHGMLSEALHGRASQGRGCGSPEPSWFGVGHAGVGLSPQSSVCPYRWHVSECQSYVSFDYHQKGTRTPMWSGTCADGSPDPLRLQSTLSTDTTTANCLTRRGQRRRRLHGEQRVESGDRDGRTPHDLMSDIGDGFLEYPHQCSPHVL